MNNLWGRPSGLRGSSRTRFELSFAGLILAGCGGLTSHGPIDPGLAIFVPADTVVLAGVRMDRLRATPIYRKLAESNRLPRFDQFRAESGLDPGFDPSRDIQELLLASDGKTVLAIARGAFPSKPAGGLNTSEYRGYTLYAKDQREAIAFIGKDVALGGPAAAVRAAIDQHKNGGGAPRDLMARAQAIPPDRQIWAVAAGWRGLGPEQLRDMGNFGNLDRVLRLLEDASLTVDLRSGVHASFTGNSRTEADAKTLGDSLRGLAMLVRMGVQRGASDKQPDLLRAMDGIQVKQEGRGVQLNVDITEDVAEKLAK